MQLKERKNHYDYNQIQFLYNITLNITVLRRSEQCFQNQMATRVEPNQDAHAALADPGINW